MESTLRQKQHGIWIPLPPNGFVTGQSHNETAYVINTTFSPLKTTASPKKSLQETRVNENKA